MSPGNKTKSPRGFALYEVLIGVAIFAIGVLALGRCVENCVNASALNAEDERVRLILANRMAEIQVTPGFPDASSATKIETGYGPVKLIQKSVPAGLKENDLELAGISLVTLTAEWTRDGIAQSRKLQFYVYRAGGV
jgi:prepilin-type N-terminal cleavage/methylation domain-containing protein